MEVQQQGEAFGLDAFAQAHHIVQVLANLRVRVPFCIFLLRIHKQAHPLGVPAHFLALEVFEHIGNPASVLVVVGHAVVQVALQYGNVAAHIPGRLFRLRGYIRRGLRLFPAAHSQQNS